MKRPQRITITFFVLILPFAGARLPVSLAADPPYTSDIPYQQAVPSFLNAVTDEMASTLTPDELRATGTWEEATRGRIQEFLDDWIAVSSQWPTASAQEIQQQYEKVLDKWSGVILSCPGCGDAASGAAPLVNELFSGLPAMRPYRYGRDVPMQNVYEWYQAMSAANPWGAGAFFQIPALPPDRKEYSLKDVYHIRVHGGYPTYTLLSREVTLADDGETVYHLLIRNDQVADQYIIAKIPTMMHGLLAEARANHLDPLLIDVLRRYVDGIDQQLRLALQDGAMPADFYDNVYGLNCDVPYGDAGFAAGCQLPSWLRRMAQKPWYEPFMTNLSKVFSLSSSRPAASAAVAQAAPDALPPAEGHVRRITISGPTPLDHVDADFVHGAMFLGFSSFLWLGMTVLRVY